jgi:hypothetical protein
MSIFSETMDGGVLIDSSADLTAIKKYFPDGIVVTTGGTADVYLAWYHSFSWDVYNDISNSISFSWNVGLQPLRYYRVLYCCQYTNPEGNASAISSGTASTPESGGCPVTGIQNNDPKCTSVPQKQFMIQNVISRDVPDLCNELAKNNLNWKICSVQRWSRPVDPTEPDPNPECNILEDIPLDGIPECAQFNLNTDSFVSIGATATLIESFYKYIGDGIVYTGGSADAAIVSGGTTPTVGSFVYSSLDGILILSGSASIFSSWDEDLVAKAGLTAFISFEEVFFGDSADVPIIVPPVTTIYTNCTSCTALPSNLYVHHNFNNPSLLYSFLKRNGLSLPDVLPFLYNDRLGTWVSHQHFKGTSDDNVYDESWRFTFEFGCYDEIAAEPTDSFVIKFAITIVRKNLQTNMDFDTKLLIVFPSRDLCEVIRNFRDDLIFSTNTKTSLTTSPSGISTETVLVYDSIGIFKSSYWYSNPNLKIKISTSDTIVTTNRKDLSFILPAPSTQLQ